MRSVLLAIVSLGLALLSEDSLASRAPCRVISAGAETDALSGSIQNAGQTAIGLLSNGAVTAHVGAVACFAAVLGAATPGDCDGDGDVDLVDFGDLAACLLGPGGGISAGCECFDFDSDGDNDLLDFADFQTLFDS
ncbi:MAG: hypothetical protein GY778_04525 [bacterium]|nr:hypothetical protein [bacterium]